jgi:Protein of unknown function (DUF3108)
MSTMKKILFTLTFLSFASILVAGQEGVLRTVDNTAFKTGEVLEYRVHYGFMDAGIARLEVHKDLKPIGSRNCFHVIGTGKSVGAFDWFFKVRDRYESYIDDKALVPWVFLRNIEEGTYKKSQSISFNHIKNTATSAKATIATPENVQDLVSSFYYARTIDYSNAKEGDLYSFDAYLDDEIIPMKLKFVGREKVKTKVGTFNCIKFHPQLLVGRVFKDADDMTIWVSDDANKVVIRAEAEILVGSVKMDLKSYEGLANEFASKVK